MPVDAKQQQQQQQHSKRARRSEVCIRIIPISTCLFLLFSFCEMYHDMLPVFSMPQVYPFSRSDLELSNPGIYIQICNSVILAIPSVSVSAPRVERNRG